MGRLPPVSILVLATLALLAPRVSAEEKCLGAVCVRDFRQLARPHVFTSVVSPINVP